MGSGIDLMYREAEPKDFDACLALLHGRSYYSEDALAALPKIWGQWLGSGVMSASVMELRLGSALPQIVQFGMNVFVTDQFMAEARTGTMPYVGVDLIARVMAGQSPVLDLAAIRAANSGAGLNLLMCHFGASNQELTPDQELLLVNRMPESFFWLHEGYNLREMLQEYYDMRIVQYCLDAGFLRRRRSADASPQVVGITREEAAANPGTYVARLFPYSVPRFFFNYGEQKVLLQAIQGRNDEEIADLLGVALSTVKKRWTAIYECVSGHLPEMLPETTLPPDLSGQKRGQEKRRRLLVYLRQHPEELRPVLPETAENSGSLLPSVYSSPAAPVPARECPGNSPPSPPVPSARRPP